MYRRNFIQKSNHSTTFQKDRKYEFLKKSIQANKKEQPKLSCETDTKACKQSWIDAAYGNIVYIYQNEHETIQEKVVENKSYKKKRRSLPKSDFEKFKQNRRFQLYMKENENKWNNLSDDIVILILDFAGLVSNINDYNLMKLGYHENEFKTMKLYKTYFLKKLKETTDNEFISIIHYINDYIDFNFRIKNRINNFLEEIKSYILTEYVDILQRYIHNKVIWEKCSLTDICISHNIMSLLYHESPKLFTKTLLHKIEYNFSSP
jgi:hypothetical protein